ncbi:hypothetical protein CU098_011937 [Rhizopus stolonifer]|uniref:Uncharacterized protein n=1 Tax=Rhizopus stolonifer TaxID=4846 RepID=A0A367KWL4_RHIST|nr:hypothetical protein CU098_011937 [Rhizopus stolonifer]
MALFVPLLIGAPIGYFTWTKVFDFADNKITSVISNEENNTSSSTLGAIVGTVGSIGILSKATFTPQTRHRLFFAKSPANSNIRIETLKLGMELLFRSGVVFYGGAVGGALAGRIGDINKRKV